MDRLDLWAENLPEFDGATISAKYARLAGREMKPAEAQAWQQITAMVERLRTADGVLIATPMWNFGIPYKLTGFINTYAGQVLLVLIPLIAGLAYEVIRFSARHLDSAACRMLIQPGLWLQRITTKEPDDTQLEIALVALKTALAYDVIEPEQGAVP